MATFLCTGGIIAIFDGCIDVEVMCIEDIDVEDMAHFQTEAVRGVSTMELPVRELRRLRNTTGGWPQVRCRLGPTYARLAVRGNEHR